MKKWSLLGKTNQKTGLSVALLPSPLCLSAEALTQEGGREAYG